MMSFCKHFMQDLAAEICRIVQQDRFPCTIQQRVVCNMETFNKFKECPCCEEHSRRKPVDIADTRGGQRFPNGDRRNYFGTQGNPVDERIDTMAEQHPRVLVFTHSQKCVCRCRHIMRKIAEDVRCVVVDCD